MAPLSAEILTEQLIGDERAAVRRSLRIAVSANVSSDVETALILNISETGILIKTAVKLADGDMLQVDIPEVSASTVRVVWTENLLAGCEFVNPVSTGAVSAAQLKSPIAATGARDEVPTSVPHLPRDGDLEDTDEASIQTAIVIVTSLISVLALLLLFAAVLPL